MFGTSSHSGRKRPDFLCIAGQLLLSVCALSAIQPLHAQNISTSPQTARQSPAELPRATLQLGEHRIMVEIAADDASRSRGLMFREQLAPDHGMLFVFPQASQMCFWMKNTPLPLTVAFINSDGSIINLADMQPQSLDTHCAIAPALYALEMEQGWFTRHSTGPGTKIQGLPRLIQSQTQ